MNYSDYQPEDFLADDTFLAWHDRTDAAHVAFWEQWLAQHPDQQPTVRAAVQLLGYLRTDTTAVPLAQQRAARERLLAQATPARVRPLYRRPVVTWLAVAASLLLVFGLGWWRGQPLTYQTAYGETRQLTLPDGSAVTLNANSTLTLERRWAGQPTRVVHLRGEAFFSVTHLASHAPFVVHANEVNVRVLGTQFNVYNRRGQTAVVLTEGKVRLRNAADQVPEVELRPGERATFSAQTKQFTRAVVNVDRYSAWRNRKLVLEDETLGQAAQALQDLYGVPFTFSSPRLAQLRFTGTLVTNDLDNCLRVLAASFQLEMERKADRIIVHD